MRVGGARLVMGMRGVGVLLVMVAVVACGGNPRPADVTPPTATVAPASTQVGVLDMTVGLCFDDAAQAEVEAFAVVACDEPHDNEVYHLAEYSASSAYPGAATVASFADAVCLDAFDDYVGLAYNESRYIKAAIVPTAETWQRGDREVVCFLFAPEGEKLVGSVRGLAE